MTDRRQRMKAAQGSGQDFIKLDIARRYDIKDEGGVIAFRTYDKEEGKSSFSTKPIRGVLLGSANIMTAFDDDLGSKGGTYTSTPYFTNSDNIAIMAGDKGGYKAYFRGTVADAELWINANTTSQRATKRKVLYLLNMQGIVSIETNMTIAIDQMGQMRDSLLDNFVKLTPAIYNPDEPDISKRAQEFLGKFAKKNPPKYAKIELDKPISDEAWAALNGDGVLDQFLAWQKSIKTEVAPAPSLTEAAEQYTPRVESAEIFPRKNNNVNYDEVDQAHETPIPEAPAGSDDDNENDDLPF
jgi:hypothetical protein